MKDLDWKKINNDKTFQRLVNDLFSLEIDNPALLSSNPDIGKDGGWDGRYQGTYMGLDGLWCFQSKQTKHDLDKAYKQLREELKTELETAKKNGVKYLLFATNADLRVGTNDHIGNLEKLNENQQYVDRLFIWPKANLENKIIQYPWLRHYYFDDCQEPMFVPPQIFAKTEPLLKGKLIERKNEIDKFKEFISDDKSNILIIHTAGGCGKTHFITEVGKMCSILNSNFQAWFCMPNIRDVNDAINDELNHQKNYLIFLDDAERYLDDAKKLIAHSKTYSPGKLKLVLSCRSSGKEIVKNMADSQRVENYVPIELSQISEKGLIEILTRSAGSEIIKHPDRIVKGLNGNLFLIVTTGKLIKGGEVDPKLIKKQIKNNLDQESINALNGLLDDNKTRDFIRELSIIVPFSKNRNNNVIEKLSDILQLDVKILKDAINKLLDANILRTIGSSIRFNPDMNGDIYLSVELDSGKGEELINQIFKNWLSIYPEKLTANLAAASRHNETDSASKAVKGLIKEWINETSTTLDSQRLKYLELITPIAYLAPDETINLIQSYISTVSSDNMYTLNRDNYGPVIYQILHIPKFQRHVARLILNIAQKEMKGTYNNYEPTTLIRQVTSPIEININLAIDSLSELLEWTEKDNCTELEAKLASDGVREALAGSHEFHESYGNQLTFGRKILIYKDSSEKAVDQYRNKGMEILKNLIFHSNDKIKKIGIGVINDIGHEATSTSDELWARIISDKKQAITWIKTLVKDNASKELLSSIEDVLIRYWANNNIYTDLSIEAANILRSFPRSPEYIIFRYYVADDIIVVNFNDIEKDAPGTDRWSWLVHKHFRLHDIKQNDLDGVVEQLSDKYKDKDELAQYLISIKEDVNNISNWQYVPLIETWSKFNKGLLIKIVNDQNLLDKVPAIFYRGIYRVASDEKNDYIYAYAQKLLGNITNLNVEDIDILLDLISRHNLPTEKFMPWIFEIIKKSNSTLIPTIIHRAYFIFKDRPLDEKIKVIDMLDLVLDSPIDNHLLDIFDFLLNKAIRWDIPIESLEKLRNRLFDVIKDLKEIDYHADNLLAFVFNDNLDKFIEFINYRLKVYKNLSDPYKYGQFDPIPNDGFKSSQGLVKNYNDFSKIMDKIIYWESEEMLYSFDIDNLLKKIKNHDLEQDDYLKQYIREQIKKGSVDNLKIAANALFGVPFNKETADLFLDILLATEQLGILDIAKDVFSHQVLTGSYSSKIGEAPPALLNKKEALTKIYDNCPPGVIKNYIDSLMKSNDDDIKMHLDDGQEIMAPKL